MSKASADDDREVEIVLEASGEASDGETSTDDGAVPLGELLSAVLEAQAERAGREQAAAAKRAAERIDGVVIGRLVGIEADGPRVDYADCPAANGLVARAGALVGEADIGRRVALLFEGGDPARPMLVGLIHHDDAEAELALAHPALKGLAIQEGDDRIEIRCRKAIGINVGKASLIITPAGHIVLRGTYVVSRASAVNRILGATVKVN